MAHPKFRAAYDFLLVRAQSSDSQTLRDLAVWWTAAQQGDELPASIEAGEQEAAPESAPTRKRRRRRGGRNRRGAGAALASEAAAGDIPSEAEDLADAGDEVDADEDDTELAVDRS